MGTGIPDPRRAAIVLFVLAGVVAGLGGPCCADTLVLANGAKFEGRLISQSGGIVAFEIQLVGGRMTIRRPASEVKQLIQERQDGPTYCVLPIIGSIGRDLEANSYVTADAFIRALSEVRAAKPDYVVLLIDSPGGLISEMDRIAAAIADAKGLTFIAYVHAAHSAAAVVAMTCPKIFMAPESSIGAAVPFRVGPDGTPQDIQEKWLSAIRASFRNTARLGGHSELLIRGMSEMAIELAVVNRDGRPHVIESTPADTGRIIKRKGQILTLTAPEALACGLSEATVPSIDAIRPYLGIRSWHLTQAQVTQYLIDESRLDKDRIVITREQAERQVAADAALRQRQVLRQAHVERIAPELSFIETRLAALDAEATAAARAEQRLIAQQNQQLLTLDADYRELRRRALNSRDPATETRRLDIEYQRARSIIMDNFQPQLIEVRERYERAAFEADQLRRRQRDLLNSIPRQ